MMLVVEAMPLSATNIALVLPVSGVFSWLLLYALVPQLRSRLLDQPNARSSHQQPTPRGGGVSFVLVASFASLMAWLSSYASASALLALIVAPLLVLPLALVSFIDDIHNLPATWRYGVQLTTALVVISVSPLQAPSVALLPLLAFLPFFLCAH